jgi:hypothetical protein
VKNRVTNLIPAPGAAQAKAKRSRRARLILSWVKVADLVDNLLDELDAAAAAGAIDPDEAGPAHTLLVSVSEEMIGTRPRHRAAR